MGLMEPCTRQCINGLLAVINGEQWSCRLSVFWLFWDAIVVRRFVELKDNFCLKRHFWKNA